MKLNTTRSHLIQLTQVSPVRPAWVNGVRAALGTVIPIIAGSALGWKAAPVWMGLAGFTVALSDKGGAMRTRFAAMSASTFWGALAAIAGAFAGRNEWLAVIAIAIWSLGAGLARVYGATATTAGILSLATFIVSLGYPAHTPRDAFLRGLFVLAGSTFAMFLALVVWPVRIYRPARRAV